MSKKTLKVKVHTDNDKFSAWSKPMEEFVASKYDRIITVCELDGYQKGYYKCDELDYYLFHDMMFTVVEEVDLSMVSAQDFQHHIMDIGTSGSNKSVLEDKLTEASKENGMILVVKSNVFPRGAMNEEVELKGRVLIASVIADNTEMIEQQLIDLNMIDEFNDSKSGKVIELATDLLSHHGNLELNKYHNRHLRSKL